MGEKDPKLLVCLRLNLNPVNTVFHGYFISGLAADLSRDNSSPPEIGRWWIVKGLDQNPEYRADERRL